MRKFFCFFVVTFVAVLILSGAANAETGSVSRPILYTWYWVIGEGDDLQIGWLDEKGNLYTLSGMFSEMNWPYEAKDQLEYLSRTENFSSAGTLTSDELFAVKSLIYDAEKQERNTVSNAEDAGTEESYAVRYTAEGDPELILLGVSGESVFENTDPNAQSLYLRLRQMFPDVVSFAYDDPLMGPKGFEPVPLAKFIGIDAEAVMTAEVEAYLTDCEIGNIPMNLSDADISELKDMIRNGAVTGKADCIFSTGGTGVYSFYGAERILLGTIELEDGLLVMSDGRYYISADQEK